MLSRPERNHLLTIEKLVSGVNENCEVIESGQKNTAKVRGFPLLSNFHWIFLWFQRFLVGHHDFIIKLQKVSSYKKNFPTKTHQRKLQLPHNKWPYKWVSGVITPINQCCNFLRTTFHFHHTQNRSLPSSGPPCGVLAASENMCPPKKRLLFLKRKGTCLLVWSFIISFLRGDVKLILEYFVMLC